MSAMGIVTSSRLLVLHLSQSLEGRGQTAPQHFASFEEISASPTASHLDLLLVDEAGQGEKLDPMLRRFAADPARRSCPVLLLHAPDRSAQAQALRESNPSIRAILQKPFAYDEFYAACRSALAPREDGLTPGRRSPASTPQIVPRLKEFPGFVAGFEWDRQAAPLSAEGAPAKPLSEVCRLALRLTGAISDSMPVGELTALAIFGDRADTVLFSSRVPGGEQGDFHVIGLLVDPGSSPDEWILAASEVGR